MYAGDPPNPWTLGCLAAEQILWDALNTWITTNYYESKRHAKERYISGGLDAVAAFIGRKCAGMQMDVFREVVPGVVDGNLRNSDHPLTALVFGYVREHWDVGQGPVASTAD